MFQYRSTEKEIMDDLNCSGEDVRQNLIELAFINKWLGGNGVTLNALQQLKKRKDFPSDQILIADIGCGGGDVLKLIGKWAIKNQIKFHLRGIDANQFMVDYAENNLKDSGLPFSISTLNIFSQEFRQTQFDIVNCTLFLHHFTDQELLELFKILKNNVNYAIVINDIHRHWFAYYSIGLLTSIFSKSFMVKNDAKLSVRRSFKRGELKKLFSDVGFANYTVKWKWAFRYQVIIYP